MLDSAGVHEFYNIEVIYESEINDSETAGVS